MTPPRGYPLQGEVHDENAYALGGVAGHAGLFSTASDLAVFAQMMLNGGEYNGTRIIAHSTVALFTRRYSSGTRALGWDTCGGTDGEGGSGGSCGRFLGPHAYGHTGFTGTSLWIDPDRKMFVILLLPIGCTLRELVGRQRSLPMCGPISGRRRGFGHRSAGVRPSNAGDVSCGSGSGLESRAPRAWPFAQSRRAPCTPRPPADQVRGRCAPEKVRSSESRQVDDGN